MSRWLHPQISLRNAGVNQATPDLSAAELLRAISVLLLIIITILVIIIIIKNLHELHLPCALRDIWKETMSLRKFSET